MVSTLSAWTIVFSDANAQYTLTVGTRVSVIAKDALELAEDGRNAARLRINGYTLEWQRCTSPSGAGTRAALVSLIQALPASPNSETVASSGTITTAGVTVARVSHGADITGAILQAGTYQGQRVTILNPANRILFAVAATSNVAGSTAAKPAQIPGDSSTELVWDTTDSLWHIQNKPMRDADDVVEISLQAAGGTSGGNEVGDENWLIGGGGSSTTIAADRWYRYPWNTERVSADWATFTAAGTGTSTTASSLLLDAGSYAFEILLGGIGINDTDWALTSEDSTYLAVSTALTSGNILYVGSHGRPVAGASNYQTGQGVFTLSAQTRIYVMRWVTISDATRTHGQNARASPGGGSDPTPVMSRLCIRKIY